MSAGSVLSAAPAAEVPRAALPEPEAGCVPAFPLEMTEKPEAFRFLRYALMAFLRAMAHRKAA